jgi:peroxiredoxin
MNRWYWMLTALAFALLIAGTMVLRWQGDGAGGVPAGAAEGDLFTRFQIERPHSAVKAEPFEAIPLNGGRPGLADYHGRYVLLNFWATWCEPCKVEMPELEALYEALFDKNVVVIAVSMQESAEKVGKFLETSPFRFPVYADPEGKVANLYGVTSIPLTYLIRPDGQIEGRALGPRAWNDPALRKYFEAKAAEK